MIFWPQQSIQLLLERKRRRSSRPLASLTLSFITEHPYPHHYTSPEECVANKIGPSALRLIYSFIQTDSNSVSSVSDECVSGPISSCGCRITDCRVLRFTDNIAVARGGGLNLHTHTHPPEQSRCDWKRCGGGGPQVAEV